MNTAVMVMLIVVFGAALMGKMLRVMYPGSVFGSSKDKKAENAE